MLRVDRNLCTGCGHCLDACTRGAITVNGFAASVDESRCDSCGRCADVCLAGAITSLETVAERSPSDAAVHRLETQPSRLEAPSWSPMAPAGGRGLHRGGLGPGNRRGRGSGSGAKAYGELGGRRGPRSRGKAAK